MERIFKDRTAAGRQLAKRLVKYRSENPIVLALPRGGVPVGVRVARELNAPLDVIVVRKLGAPGQPELGMGAVAEGGVQVLDENIVRATGTTQEELTKVIKQEEAELERRVRLYRGNNPLPPLAGRAAILVDDGLATGATARAATHAVKLLHPKKIILAVPVCAPDTLESLKPHADEIICLATPPFFPAISSFYEQFPQVSDSEVVHTLRSL